MRSPTAPPPSSSPRPDTIGLATLHGAPVLDVVLPVRDEGEAVEESVRRLHSYMREHLPYRTQVTIADSGSADDTPRIAQALVDDLEGVRMVRFEQSGRGRALRAAWSSSPAPVLASMSVGVSVDLAALGPLAAPLISGHSDISLGFRPQRSARHARGTKQSIVSRCDSMLLDFALRTKLPAARCGFNAIRKEAARVLLPHVADDGCFFDTELLVLAERVGLRVYEVAVDWADGDDRPDDATTADDLRGSARLAWGLLVGAVPVCFLADQLGSTPARGLLFRQIARFAAAGRRTTEVAHARKRSA